MKYKDIVIAMGFLLLVTGMMVVTPARAEKICGIDSATGYKVCKEIVQDERGLSYYMYGIDSYTEYTYTYRPTYKPEIKTPSVPHHNEGDCMISMGCTR